MATDEIDLTVVTLEFDATDPERLAAVLARYVVLSRGHVGCRNIDLCASDMTENRYLIVEKWASAADQQRHFDSAEMVEMAESCTGILARPPRIDLLRGVSAHDLA